MNFFIQISVLIIAVQWCSEVKCKPHLSKKYIFKRYQIGLVPIPKKHASFLFEKITPFGTFEFKHSIKKRQIAEAELPPPLQNEVHASEEVGKVEKIPAQVLINTVIEPLEPGKQISFLLPVDSEVKITPAVKEVADSVPLASEVAVNPETEVKVEEVVPVGVVEEVPKPIEIPPPDVVLPPPAVVVLPPPEEIPPPPVEVPVQTEVLPTVPILTPIENVAPPLAPVPVFQNPNIPIIGPIISNVPATPFLYTNINRIPFFTPTNVVPFFTPGAIPIPEPVVPQMPLPTKINPPVLREDPPNFLVKSSRFVLYFGSMMLQMLSQFINGRTNANPIPLAPPIPVAQ